MQALINTVWRGLQWLGNNVGNWLSGMWAGFVEIARFFADWFASFYLALTTLVVEGFFALVLFLVELLPMMPEGTAVGSISALEVANRYIALGEILAFSAVWVTLFGAIGVYKGVKLVRGGG